MASQQSPLGEPQARVIFSEYKVDDTWGTTSKDHLWSLHSYLCSPPYIQRLGARREWHAAHLDTQNQRRALLLLQLVKMDRFLLMHLRKGAHLEIASSTDSRGGEVSLPELMQLLAVEELCDRTENCSPPLPKPHQTDSLGSQSFQRY